MRTKVAIIGAGPAGMFLAHILKAGGVDAVVVERRDRDYVEGRVRAGVLEQITVDLMTRLGLDSRVHELGLPHGGTNIACDGDVFRVDLEALTGGGVVTVYGQQEVMKDLFDADDVALHDLDICGWPLRCKHEFGLMLRSVGVRSSVRPVGAALMAVQSD